MKFSSLRLLNPDDNLELLAFEQANQHWFEQLIAPRGQDFYSQQGITRHIQQCLQLHAEGKMYPCLILNCDNEIIGRANLHNIESASDQAEIGYRMAEETAGKGIATIAVKQLVTIAFNQLKLKTLKANVLDNNPASARILQKLGFKLIGQLETPVFIQNIACSGQRWQLKNHLID